MILREHRQKPQGLADLLNWAALVGWFTQAVVTDADIDLGGGSTPPYGAIAVKPAG